MAERLEHAIFEDNMEVATTVLVKSSIAQELQRQSLPDWLEQCQVGQANNWKRLCRARNSRTKLSFVHLMQMQHEEMIRLSPPLLPLSLPAPMEPQ